MHEVARYRCLFALVCSSDFETRDFASLLFVLICSSDSVMRVLMPFSCSDVCLRFSGQLATNAWLRLFGRRSCGAKLRACG